ncbi:glycosyltransferase family 4 protein [Candidatus Bathyarchaeota archaeon]|nr:glycosyltransferase family 4 protein [Candidatus Bathyarchaeota archaeon]
MGFFYNGGGERTVLNQAIELGKRGHTVEVFAPTVEESCFPNLMEKVSLTETSGLLPRGMPLRNALGMIYSSVVIPRKRIQGFDVILAHGQPSGWIAANVKKMYGTPVASYLHQVNRFFMPRKIDRQTGWATDGNLMLLEALHRGNTLVKKLDSYSVRCADTVLTNSEYIKTKIADYYEVEPHVCYPGVNLSLFRKTGRSEAGEPYLLSTNRHYPQKRLDYLIRCMRILAPMYPHLKCYITGGFTKHSEFLVQLTTRLGLKENVFFTGNLSSPELIEKYQNAYVYAFTSPEEDFGLGPIEAAACGVPSIVWDSAGPRETVMHGVTGYRVTPFSVKEMAALHAELLGDRSLRDKMGDAAHRFSTKRFSWETHVDKLERYLLELC